MGLHSMKVGQSFGQENATVSNYIHVCTYSRLNFKLYILYCHTIRIRAIDICSPYIHLFRSTVHKWVVTHTGLCAYSIYIYVYISPSIFCASLGLAYIYIYVYVISYILRLIHIINIYHFVGAFTCSYNFNSQKPPICATGLLHCLPLKNPKELTHVCTSIE